MDIGKIIEVDNRPIGVPQPQRQPLVVPAPQKAPEPKEPVKTPEKVPA